jgi:hypothetical protein
VFAPECREWLVQAAHGAGVTAAHVAVPLIGIASALIGTARRVQAVTIVDATVQALGGRCRL